LNRKAGSLSPAIEDGLGFSYNSGMLAECERIFSAAGKTVVAERNRLEVEAIAMCQVLRLWYLAGVIKDSNRGLEPLQVSEGGGDDENSDERNVGGAEQQSGAEQVVTLAARNTGS
jgi:hypothetical protein